MKAWIVFVTLFSSLSVQAICSNWDTPIQTGNHSKTISEASGLTASKLKPGMFFWTNDSGKKGEIYATGVDGKIVKTVSIQGFSNVDFEALEQGPCPGDLGSSCLYVGDVGDFIGWRNNFKIGVFKEKDFWSSKRISPIAVKKFKYPKRSGDSEALLVTNSADVLIFSKSSSGVARLYKTSFMDRSSRVKQVGSLDLNRLLKGTRGDGPKVTDASYSRKKDSILLLTYGDIVEVRSDLVLLSQATANWVKNVDYQIIKAPKKDMPQKETITYFDNGKKMLVSSESPEGPGGIYTFNCLD